MNEKKMSSIRVELFYDDRFALDTMMIITSRFSLAVFLQQKHVMS